MSASSVHVQGVLVLVLVQEQEQLQVAVVAVVAMAGCPPHKPSSLGLLRRNPFPMLSTLLLQGR
jgi:hypothetical protein